MQTEDRRVFHHISESDNGTTGDSSVHPSNCKRNFIHISESDREVSPTQDSRIVLCASDSVLPLATKENCENGNDNVLPIEIISSTENDSVNSGCIQEQKPGASKLLDCVNSNSIICVDNTIEYAKIYDVVAENRICPMNVQRCRKLFDGYDKLRLDNVVNNIEFGVKLHSSLVESCRDNDFYNHKSALDNHELVSEKIKKEVSLGRIAGPFSTKPPGLIVSPLASVPKDNGSSIRLIHDLSYPKNHSVNSHIPKELCTVEYETLDDCLFIISTLGEGCLMSKSDIKNAYRIFECSRQDYRLLGFTWLNMYYFDRCLPMGCAISCAQFEEFSKLIHWVLTEKFGIQFMSHIIDDFMFFGPKNSTLCQQFLDIFISVSSYLGIPIKHEKTFNATTCLQLHGIQVCTLSMTASLPKEKIEKALFLINNMLSVDKTKMSKMQELCGFLNFCLRIIPSGRPFMRGLYDLTKGNKPRWFSIRLNSNVKQDLLVWKQFLISYNGKVIISKDVWTDKFEHEVFSDASGFAFAAFYNDRWIQGEFPKSWEKVNIAVKEFVPVYLSYRMWFSGTIDSRLLFHVDNESVVYMINNQTSNVDCILKMMRNMVLVGMKNNVQFQSQHIRGKDNLTADFLSRLQTAKAFQQSPGLQQVQDQIPPEWKIWDELLPLSSETL